MKVYICDSDDVKRAYICRGALMDHIVEAKSTREVVVVDRTVVGVDGVPVSEEDLKRQSDVWVSIKELEAYLGEVPAESIDEAAGYEKYPLDTTEIPPLKFPVRATFVGTKGGRIGCRLNTHPERDGLLNVGIMVFPDRSWHSAKEGEVRIDRVMERDTFGFVWGRQVKYDLPPLQDVVRFVSSQPDLEDYKLYRLRGTPHGAYFGLVHEGAGIYRRIAVTKNGLEIVPYRVMADDMMVGSVVPVDVPEMTIEGIFGKGVTEEQLFSQLVGCEFGPRSAMKNRQLTSTWEECTETVEDEVIRVAVGMGLLEQFMLAGTNIICYEPKRIPHTFYGTFTKEGYNMLVAKVKSVNEAAANEIRGRIKSGKLQLQCMTK